MSHIKHLVVHCSDTPDDRDVTAAEIHRWHKQRGWDGIGYHAVITRDGIVEMGRPVYWPGAHVRGHNSSSLGVCLIGNEHYSCAQYKSLETVIRQWLRRYPSAQVVGHCDLDSQKTCPNFDVKQWAFARRLIPFNTQGKLV